MTLAENLVALLRSRSLTVATAESCTGGLVSELITAVPGASEVFVCGVCTYTNESKQSILGVSPDTLSRYGAVSRQTACEMAGGIRRVSGADITVSVTGIAGPGGGTPSKPVGTVWLAVSSQHGKETEMLSLDPSLTRGEIRDKSAMTALGLLMKEAEK